jgi:hypothetical protein
VRSCGFEREGFCFVRNELGGKKAAMHKFQPRTLIPIS